MYRKSGKEAFAVYTHAMDLRHRRQTYRRLVELAEERPEAVIAYADRLGAEELRDDPLVRKLLAVARAAKWERGS